MTIYDYVVSQNNVLSEAKDATRLTCHSFLLHVCYYVRIVKFETMIWRHNAHDSVYSNEYF